LPVLSGTIYEDSRRLTIVVLKSALEDRSDHWVCLRSALCLVARVMHCGLHVVNCNGLSAGLLWFLIRSALVAESDSSDVEYATRHILRVTYCV